MRIIMTFKMVKDGFVDPDQFGAFIQLMFVEVVYLGLRLKLGKPFKK